MLAARRLTSPGMGIKSGDPVGRYQVEGIDDGMATESVSRGGRAITKAPDHEPPKKQKMKDRARAKHRVREKTKQKGVKKRSSDKRSSSRALPREELGELTGGATKKTQEK